MKTSKNYGVIVSGGNLSAENLAVGSNSSITVSKESQPLNFDILSKELLELKLELKNRAKDSEHFLALSEIAKAEQALVVKDEKTFLDHLLLAGKWVADIAKEVGAKVLTELIKGAI